MSAIPENKNIVPATKVGGARHKEHKKHESPKYQPNNPPINPFFNTLPQIVVPEDKTVSQKTVHENPTNKHPPINKNINHKNHINRKIEQPKQGPY